MTDPVRFPEYKQVSPKNGRGGSRISRPFLKHFNHAFASTMLSSVLTIYFIDSRRHQIYSSNMRNFIAAIKRGVSRRPLEVESVLAFECSMKWDELLKTDSDESQRFCTSCSKNVYLTVSDLAFKENARRGRCVSIPAGTKLKIKGEDVIIESRLGGAPVAFDDDDDDDLWGPSTPTPRK